MVQEMAARLGMQLTLLQVMEAFRMPPVLVALVVAIILKLVSVVLALVVSGTKVAMGVDIPLSLETVAQGMVRLVRDPRPRVHRLALGRHVHRAQRGRNGNPAPRLRKRQSRGRPRSHPAL